MIIDKTARYTSSSAKVIPASLEGELGISAITSVLVLLILVTIIGGAAHRFYSVEALQTSADLVNYRLQQNARMGLEATYTLLNSMGARTSLIGTSAGVETGVSATNGNITDCSYFPRTDDVILPIASGSNYADTSLSDSNNDCLTARPNSASLTPIQLDRYVLTSGTAISNNTYNTSGLLNAITSATTSTDKSFRSIFPWVRYRNQSGIMDAQYGTSEAIQTQINQCGLSSNFINSTATGAVPVQRYPYLQKFDGLGTSWLNLGSSLMNVNQNGLTLEAWVWVASSSTANRTWQRIFDIGRGQQDQNIVLAYNGNTGQVTFQIFPAAANPSSTTHAGSGSGSPLPTNITVPANATTGFDTSSNNDLWYYIAAVLSPAGQNSANLNVYTACKASLQTTTDGNSACTTYSPVTNSNFGTGSQALKQAITNYSIDNSYNSNYQEYRQTYVGYSLWGDAEFQGMMKELRVWNTALSSSQLGAPINPTYSTDIKNSTIITNTTQNQSLRISPLYSNGTDRLLLFTVQETGQTFNNTFRLVSCAWNTKVPKRVTRSIRFRVIGTSRPEILEYLPY